MKAILVITALVALAAAGPAKHRRGACPAKPSKTYDNGGDSQTTADWAQPSQTDDGNDGGDSDGDSGNSTGVAVCPADGGKTLKSTGSCGCSYAINCASKADHGSSTQFWEKTSGQIVLSLAECVAMCDDNSDCQAVIW